MSVKSFLQAAAFCTGLILTAVSFSGCETTNSSAPAPSAGSSAPSPSSHFSREYHADDGRNIVIGRATADNGGWRFREPHLDKCWIADGFNFTGYDTIYIAPTLSTAKFRDGELGNHDLAAENIVLELKRFLNRRSLFPNIVTEKSAIKPEAHVLKLENTIVEYSQGDPVGRQFFGLMGAGQPMLRVKGKMTDGEKMVCEFEGHRSGVSVGAHFQGGLWKDQDIQLDDVRSLVLDLTDFMAAIAGKYTPRG